MCLFPHFKNPQNGEFWGYPPLQSPPPPPPPPPPPFPEKGGPEEVSRESWGKSRDPPLPPYLGGPPPPIYGGCSLYQNRTQNVCPAGYPPSGVVHESAPLYKSVIFCQKMALLFWTYICDICPGRSSTSRSLISFMIITP